MLGLLRPVIALLSNVPVMPVMVLVVSPPVVVSVEVSWPHSEDHFRLELS